MQRAAILFMVLVGLATSGCVISVHDDDADVGWGVDDHDWQRRQKHNQEVISYLELGRGVDSVSAEMGTPDMTESFLRQGREFRVLYYRTRVVHEDGHLTRDETTPLVFVDGELVGWGESALEYAMP